MKKGKLAKVELAQSRNQNEMPARVRHGEEICKTKSRKVEQSEMNVNSGNSDSETDNIYRFDDLEHRLRIRQEE